MTLTAERISEALRTARTPFYIFDTDEAADEIRRMHEVLPERVKVCFSIKANPYLTEALGKAADYVEACSFGELRICSGKRSRRKRLCCPASTRERMICLPPSSGMEAGSPTQRNL